jgi:hypothetical protein
MKRTILIMALCIAVGAARAQTNLARENRQKDSVVKASMIDPAVQEARGEAPDWTALAAAITQKHDAVTADRTITRAIIYFTYGKDWPAFTGAIVKYTEKYEDHDNLRLLNFNANIILKYSQNKKELETALGWSRQTAEKDTANADYKKTLDALSAKIATN